MGHRSKIAAVLSDTHSHDTVRFDVQSPNGDFTLEFGTDRNGAVWNVSDSPPPFDTSGYTVEAEGEKFILLDSPAESVDDVVDELRDLIGRVSPDHATVYNVKTFTRAKGLHYHLEPAIKRVKAVVPGVSG